MFVAGGYLRIIVSVIGAPLGCGSLYILLCGSLGVSRVCAGLLRGCGEGPMRFVRSGGQGGGALGRDVQGVSVWGCGIQGGCLCCVERGGGLIGIYFCWVGPLILCCSFRVLDGGSD